MDPKLETALQNGGAIDPDVVALFGEVVKEYEAGTITADAAVNRMRLEKPVFFKDADKMNPGEFRALESQVRGGVRGVDVPGAIPAWIREIDAAMLDDRELRELGKAIGGVHRANSTDLGLLRRAHARQRSAAS